MNKNIKKFILPITILILVIILSAIGGNMFGKWLRERNSANTPPIQDGITAIINNKMDEVSFLLSGIYNRDSLILDLNEQLKASKRKTETVYNNTIIQSPDTCRPYLNQLYHACNETDSLNKIAIELRDSSLREYAVVTEKQKDVIDLQKYKLAQKSDSIAGLIENKKDLEKLNKREHRRGNIKAILSSIGGFLVGAGTSKLIP